MNNVGVETTDQDIQDKYKELFNRVGLLKHYELKVNVITSVKPVAQPIRRIPLGVREKVEKKLDELLACGIIEEVPEGPTSWVSPLDVAPKPDGDVKICIDMRCANQEIIIIIISHVDLLLLIISHVDLKWGFRLIPLAEESRHVTTFVTHSSLYRYTRLVFHVWGDPSTPPPNKKNNPGCIEWL